MYLDEGTRVSDSVSLIYQLLCKNRLWLPEAFNDSAVTFVWILCACVHACVLCGWDGSWLAAIGWIESHYYLIMKMSSILNEGSIDPRI